MRTFLFLVSWLAVVGGLRSACAQQLICQQQHGQTVPQQGFNLFLPGGMAIVNPDSASLYRLTAPSGINAGLTLQAGLVWLKRGSCDTARFASLAAKLLPNKGSLGQQSTFLLTTNVGRCECYRR